MFLCGIVALASASFQQPPEPARIDSAVGTYAVKSVTSRHLNNTRDITVLLPEGYEKDTSVRYPVLYMHDSQNIFNGKTSYIPNQEWKVDETSRAMARAGLVQKLIIVGIPNMGIDRANEYLPTRAKFGRQGEEEVGGKADLYGKFLIEEVKPLIDSTFRTKKGPGDTGLCGSSFGGIISLHLGMTRPDVFGRLGVVSPSLWWDNGVMQKRIEQQKFPWKVRMWMDMGTQEGDGAIRARAFEKTLIAKGMKPKKDFIYFEEEGGQHNEAAWARRFGEILLFLFPAK
jgi:predicted alpha/beta superfamily hydrolase